MLICEVPVNIPIQNSYGSEPIHLAAMEGQLKVIDVLLSFKADINARDRYWVYMLYLT